MQTRRALRALGGDEVNDALDARAQDFTHMVTENAPYYLGGPWQPGPPDGTLPAETKVALLRVAGSYVLVRSEDGNEAWMAADRITAIQRTPEGDFQRLADEGVERLFTHVTIEDTPYFVEAPPALGLPQDEVLPADTRVMLLDVIGSGQVQIQSEDGIEAWVDATYLRPIEEG